MGGEEVRLGEGCPERGKGNNGHIMDGRSPGIDGRRRDGGGGRAADAVLPILCHGDEVKVVVGDF